MQGHLLVSTEDSAFLARQQEEKTSLVVVPGRTAKLYRQGWSAYFSAALLLHILTYVPFIAFG